MSTVYFNALARTSIVYKYFVFKYWFLRTW